MDKAVLCKFDTYLSSKSMSVIDDGQEYECTRTQTFFVRQLNREKEWWKI